MTSPLVHLDVRSCFSLKEGAFTPEQLVHHAAHMLGERSDPSLTANQICAHAAGLVALLGPRSAPGRLAAAGRTGAAREAAGPFREAFGRDRCVVVVEDRVERESHDEVRSML